MTEPPLDSVLILTPVKDAARHLPAYFERLERLDYPPGRISLGLLESDSLDDTAARVEIRLDALRRRYAAVGFWRKDFGFRIPPGRPRWDNAFQLPRRKILARARNHLLFRALDDQDWVLWLDVDVIDYPADLLHRLIATGRDILQPHCVSEPGGPTFDRNAWRDHGRVHMDQLRGGADFVRLDSVGGTVLMVRADIHRDGLVFPPFPYGAANPAVRRPHPFGPAVLGEIETEGLGLMAADMGHQCWGMPNLEVRHEKN
jgi:Anp1